MINCKDFITQLVAIGLKASEITKVIRDENSLFDLLIEGKKATEYLKDDFKTFADVLIQETVRNDLEIMHPGLSEHLYGEETNEFTNKLNVTIKIRIGDSQSDTLQLILQVLDSHYELASKLADIIHKDLKEFIDGNLSSKFDCLQQSIIKISDLGFWIDPIDSTAEYIHGLGHDNSHNINSNNASVRNVTVLLGAFFLQSGIPFAGVVYQPFSHQNTEGKWQHACYWGIHRDGVAIYSDNVKTTDSSKSACAMTSKLECAYFSERLNSNEQFVKWNVDCIAGAGYKFSLMLEGKCDMYILSKGTTYKWDTCGPHAILLAIGGGVVDYQQVLREVGSLCVQGSEVDIDQVISDLLTKWQLTYLMMGDDNCNGNGFLAYSNVTVAISVIKMLLGAT